MISTFTESGFVILANQNKRRKENSFQGHDQSEERKWKGIKMPEARQSVNYNPSAEPNHMHPYERKAAAKLRDDICHPIG